MQTGINGEKNLKTYLCNKDYCNAGEQLGGDYDLLGALGPIGKGLKDAIDVGLEAVDQGRKGLKGLKDAVDAAGNIGKKLNDGINAVGPILGEGLKEAINTGLGTVGNAFVDWLSDALYYATPLE